jgi:hypothetical protein
MRRRGGSPRRRWLRRRSLHLRASCGAQCPSPRGSWCRQRRGSSAEHWMRRLHGVPLKPGVPGVVLLRAGVVEVFIRNLGSEKIVGRWETGGSGDSVERASMEELEEESGGSTCLTLGGVVGIHLKTSYRSLVWVMCQRPIG